MMMAAAVAALLGAGFASARAGENPCEKVVQGTIVKLDNVNKRFTLKTGDGSEQTIPTSNATTIDEAPVFNKVGFEALKEGLFLRVCTERGFATSATIGNACDKVTDGSIVKLDEVNKRFTLQLADGSEQMIPTSNATQLLAMPKRAAMAFGDLKEGETVVTCTSRGFAVAAAVSHIPAPAAENKCEKRVQGAVTKIDPVNKRFTVKAGGAEQDIPTSNATTIDEAPNENKVGFDAVKVGSFLLVCTEKGFATSVTIGNSCGGMVEGNITKLDGVNKRFTLKCADGSEKMVPTSNATQLLQWSSHSSVTFEALKEGQYLRACTDRGFATNAAIMN